MQSAYLVYYVVLCLITRNIETVVVEMEFSNERVFKFEKLFAACPRNRASSRVIGRFTNISISPEDKSKINYILVFNKDSHPDEMKIHFTKCPSKEALASCSFLTAFTARNPCRLMKLPNEVYSPMISCFTPEFTCPIAKGVYRGRNCWMNFKMFNWFPVDSSYWKVKVEFFERRKLLICSYFEGAVIRVT